MRSRAMSKILIVDDEPEQIRAPMKRQLRRAFRNRVEDLKILEADNGKEALEIIEQEIPDVVILDVMMPVMDGVTACRNIRANPAYSHIYIIMLTGRDGGMAEGLEVGADLYLRKPYDFEILKVSVTKGLQRDSRREVGALDPSTGLFNQSFFMSTILPKELNSAERYREACVHPLSLIMAKVRGEAESPPADEVMGKIIKGLQFRLSDRGAYMGEGEMVILLPNTPAHNAMVTAQRIRQTVQQYGLHSYVGITSYDHGESLIYPLAEDNMNLAESHGANTICLNDEVLASLDGGNRGELS
uniref:Putative Two-component response regulator n=1 Tax=Magnetococcus massalia (strain MO-1) TaxID=451514 RepID=A0A1S7LLF8_MAGMO|nr:putative Two-component response regulator [Candidatus Magnetococcus massalia]